MSTTQFEKVKKEVRNAFRRHNYRVGPRREYQKLAYLKPYGYGMAAINRVSGSWKELLAYINAMKSVGRNIWIT